MKVYIQKFGKTLSAMVMPNMGAFIAWGFITALFIEAGWFPVESLATLVGPMLNYLLPILIAHSAGKMFGGDKGAVTASIAVIGVILGAPDQAMLIGAMVIGPIAGISIKIFDDKTQDKIKAGFEMLVNNFSVGIIGMLLAIIGYYIIGPIMTMLLGILTVGVDFLITKGILPLVAIFIEPAKVLFLNNAINHGILTPLGTEQVAETGKSIMYMLESNPGPGLGIILAYMVFSKNKTTKGSAVGASVIHFFGGIHEIYFPYVLMNPATILGPIIASIATIFYYGAFNTGLVAPAAPGSIIAYLAVSPKGETLIVMGGVLLATVISFAISSIFVHMAGDKSLEEAQEQMAQMKAESKGLTSKSANDIRKIVFACDAGMGSSAMGATKFRKRISDLNLDIIVTNTSVDTVPADADIVVCQQVLRERAVKSASNAEIITIGNFLADSNLDALYNKLSALKQVDTEEIKAVEEIAITNEIATNTNVFAKDNILLGLEADTKEDVIMAAGELLVKRGYANSAYIAGMLEREETATTCIGFGVAIPHGTISTKHEVKETGIVFLQYPNGVSFGDETVYLVFGIAASGDEHLEILAQIADIVEDEEQVETLKTTSSIDKIMELIGQNL
ncbi:MAG: PTS mannitol transporter subunit IICBA [Candidatus Epulonipiscioides saccharophilum]|nr:MAG: PTS mannitol transporter subunit IICBA [Epulopiscium sp. AS2M-Bin001]